MTKKLFISIAVLFNLHFAQALEIPQCWEQWNGQREVAEREYIVSVDVENISKDQILTLLQEFRGFGHNFSPLSYPAVSFDRIRFLLKANESSSQEEMEQSLKEILQNYDARVECNGIVHTNPGGIVHN